MNNLLLSGGSNGLLLFNGSNKNKLSLYSIISSYPWLSQTSGDSYDLLSISAVDSSTCWVSGKISGGPSSYNNVYYTSNGGSSWNNVGLSNSYDCYSVYGFNSSTAIVGTQISGGFYWYKTINAGSTWTLSSYTGGVVTGTVYGLSFYDSTHGFAACTSTYTFRTTNGGTSWSQLYYYSTQAKESLLCISSPDVSTYYAGGTDGFITWTQDTVNFYSSSPGVITYSSITGISFPKNSKVGLFCDASGYIWKMDATSVISPVITKLTVNGKSTSFSSITMDTSLIGWACGTNGVIKYTSDGTNWNDQNSNTSTVLSGISSIGDFNHVWACGSSGFITNTITGGK